MDGLDREARRRRLAGNLLLGDRRLGDAARVVSALCGIQAQDLPAARLSIRARSTGLTDAGVEAVRVKDRSIVRTWGMRGTLHLIASEDLGWLRRLLAPGLIRGSARRSEQLGLDDAAYRKALSILQTELAGVALTRAELKPVFEAAGIDPSGQRLVYLLYRAAVEGLICEGPQDGGKPTYVLLDEWLHPGAREADGGIERLLRRYLAAYGPAGPEDFATWSGLSLTSCREAFLEAGVELEEVPVQGRPAWILQDTPQPATAGCLRLLPAFDTFLLGYRRRDLHLDPKHASKVNAGGGIVKPVVLVDGRVKGTWRLVRGKGGLQAMVEPFGRVPAGVAAGLREEARDIGRFLASEVSLSEGKPSGQG